jgi:hypothetical protein
MLDGLFLSFYGAPAAAITIDVGAGLAALRAAGFIEREFIAAQAAEEQLAALMRALKACTGGSPGFAAAGRTVRLEAPVNPCAAAVQALTSVSGLGSLWTDADRLIIEQALGGNLPKGFEYIDIWDALTRTATSVKSIDLRYDTYRVSNSAIVATGKKYVDDLVNFRRNGALLGEPKITPDMVDRYILGLAYPEGATASQLAALQKVVDYGAQNGIVVYLYPIRG